MNDNIVGFNFEGARTFLHELWDVWGDLSYYGFDNMPTDSIDTINDQSVLKEILMTYMELETVMSIPIDIHELKSSELN